MINNSPNMEMFRKEAIRHTSRDLAQYVYMLLVQSWGEEKAGEIWMQIGYPAIVSAGYYPLPKNTRLNQATDYRK